LITPEENIDLDEWIYQLHRSMSEYCNGKVEVKVPFISALIFRDSDIDSLKRYIIS